MHTPEQALSLWCPMVRHDSTRGGSYNRSNLNSNPTNADMPIATLNTLSYAQVLAATKAATGRAVCQADRLEMTSFGDCVRNDFWWNDGACYSMLHDTKEEALAHAASNGFLPKPPIAD